MSNYANLLWRHRNGNGLVISFPILAPYVTFSHFVLHVCFYKGDLNDSSAYSGRERQSETEKRERERKMDGWMNGWVSGWVHWWMDGCMDYRSKNGKRRRGAGERYTRARTLTHTHTHTFRERPKHGERESASEKKRGRGNEGGEARECHPDRNTHAYIRAVAQRGRKSCILLPVSFCLKF